MRNTITLIFFSGILFFGFSCQYRDKEIKPILQQVELILEQSPDSALVLLEQVADPQFLSRSLYCKYSLLLIQAKDKCDQDISSDTIIFDIADYYQNKNDIENAALASFYSGKILQKQEKDEEALRTYLDTEQYLKHSNNDNLKGLQQSAIGSIYNNELVLDKAIIHFKKAKNNFHSAKNYRKEIVMSTLIANCFLMEEKSDSAFQFYFYALASADSLGYEKEQASVLGNLGVAYRETKDWKNAEYYFRKIWDFADDSLHIARTSFNLANLFDQMGKSDSAIYYIQNSFAFLPANSGNYLLANVYETWSAISEKAGVFQEALEKYKVYSDYLAMIFDENRDRAVREVEQKYNYQLVENRNKQLVIERQRILLLATLLLLFLFALVFVLFHRYKQNKAQLKETERKVRKLSELAKSFNAKEDSFRNILIQHFDILKKAALLEGYLKEDEKRKGKFLLQKFNEVVYGEKSFNWDLLYESLNALNDNFFNRLKAKFPQLDESEFRICCLLAVDFSNTEIAIILNYSINTVQVKRSMIRKKLGIKPFGNIRDFLNMVLEIS